MKELNTTPPKKNENFVHYWETFLPDIEDRENLKNSHLMQLRVLCDMCVELDELQELIDMEGRTYESHGRNGTQIKMRPEVQEKNKLITEIRNYSKILGLVLVKDTKMKEEEEKNEFN